MSDPDSSVPVLSREDLDNIPSRPQLWGKQIETTENGIRLRIRIPANYGSGEVNSRWPVVIFLKDTRGFIEENLDPDDSYVHDKTYTNMAPFVTISPYVSDSAFVWNSDTIFKMQNVLLELRHILFISVRRVYLIGIGSGAHAALKWTLQYPVMFAAIVLVSPHFVDGVPPSTETQCTADDVQARSTLVLDDETEASFNENHVKITTTTPSWRVCTSVDEMKRIITVLPVDELLTVARKTARLTVLLDNPKPRNPADATGGDGEHPVDGATAPNDDTDAALKAERKELLRSAQLYSWLLEFSQPINLGIQSKVEPMAARLSALSLDVQAMGDSAGDVYGTGVGLQRFEAALAGHLGKRAGLFCLSGTCANQVAVQTAADMAKAEQTAAMHRDDMLSTSPSNASFRRSELYSSGTSWRFFARLLIFYPIPAYPYPTWTSPTLTYPTRRGTRFLRRQRIACIASSLVASWTVQGAEVHVRRVAMGAQEHTVLCRRTVRRRCSRKRGRPSLCTGPVIWCISRTFSTALSSGSSSVA
eukprot:m.603717 g.603717  ORF g.603717 m.603717 type:complete len:533 (-) comp22456_c0_seq6:2160-3758(-)